MTVQTHCDWHTTCAGLDLMRSRLSERYLRLVLDRRSLVVSGLGFVGDELIKVGGGFGS